MKKLAIFVAAFVLTLGLAQCKKEQMPANTASESVFITLNVGPATGSGADGSRVQVNPTSSQQVTFTNGDRILVASGGHYVGYLQHDGTNFSGTITNPVVGQPLCFFFLGNKMDVSQLEVGSSTTCTVNIGNQTNELPVLSFSESNETYNGAGAYSATLQNKCALVKFSTNVESRTVKVAGMSTVANINFATGTITPDATTTGTVSFKTDSQGEGWAILLEQDGVSDATVAAVGYQDGTCDVPAITNNLHYTAGVSVNLTAVGISQSGTIGDGVHYVFYSDGTLYFSGSGTVPGQQFDNWPVKKIIFDENCTISKLESKVYQIFSYDLELKLTDIEINTTVPLQLDECAIAWYKDGGTVNVTVKAPSLTLLGKNPFICGEGENSVVNLFMDVTAPIDFEKNTFLNDEHRPLTSNDVVTIHSGCRYHVPAGIIFTDEMIQDEYNTCVEYGDVEWFWDEYNYLQEGVDYIIVEESWVVITAENASEVFGAATVHII